MSYEDPDEDWDNDDMTDEELENSETVEGQLQQMRRIRDRLTVEIAELEAGLIDPDALVFKCYDFDGEWVVVKRGTKVTTKYGQDYTIKGWRTGDDNVVWLAFEETADELETDRIVYKTED